MLREEITMLEESASAAVRKLSPVSMLREIRDSTDETGFSQQFWRECSKLGWAGVLVDEDHGGSDLGFLGAGTLAREMGRTLSLSPFLSTSIMAASALKNCRNELLRQEWLPKIAAGSVIVAAALEEDTRHKPQVCSTNAVQKDDGYCISGRKIGVVDGHVADAIIVSAIVEGEGAPALFLVPADRSGLSVWSHRWIDGRQMGSCQLDNVFLRSTERLREDTSSLYDWILFCGRAVLAARLCGMADEIFRQTLEYLKQRRQFDRPIASFQAIQHRAATMHCEIENAWSSTLAALGALDSRGPDVELIVSVAKAKASEVACFVAAECLQFHGGVGMTDEFDVGLYLKQARVEAEMLGGSSFHANNVARLLGY